MKKIFTVLVFLICFASFAEENFKALDFVVLPKGTYVQGNETESFPVEREVKSFSINKYETTYGLWYEVRLKAEARGYVFQNPGQPGSGGKRGVAADDFNSFQPVTNVTWYDVIVWLNALSEVYGQTPCYKYKGKVLKDSTDTAACDLAVCDWKANGYRLPSEAEWEYASRYKKKGFAPSDKISGQSTNSTSDGLRYAWTSKNATGTRVVGTAGLPFNPNVVSQSGTGNANEAGLFDMSGNVLEYCWDWLSNYDEKKPYGPDVGNERVSRGGSWSDYTPFNYTGIRYSFDPNECYNYMGFRICSTVFPKN